MKIKQLAIKLIPVAFTLAVFVYELNALSAKRIIEGPDELIIYAIRSVFIFIALPAFAIARVLDYFDLFSEDQLYQAKVFYKAVYLCLAVYSALVVADRYFNYDFIKIFSEV